MPAHIGYNVNGVALWGWTDGTSYLSEGVWNNLAMKFEVYDLDICRGHAAADVYHRKFVFSTIFFNDFF